MILNREKMSIVTFSVCQSPFMKVTLHEVAGIIVLYLSGGFFKPVGLAGIQSDIVRMLNTTTQVSIMRIQR